MSHPFLDYVLESQILHLATANVKRFWQIYLKKGYDIQYEIHSKSNQLLSVIIIYIYILYIIVSFYQNKEFPGNLELEPYLQTLNVKSRLMKEFAKYAYEISGTSAIF